MINATVYTIVSGALSGEHCLAADIADITRALERCNGDTSMGLFIDINDSYLSFDPNNLVIKSYLERGKLQSMLEQHPWLDDYCDGVESVRPADDVAARVSNVQAAVESYQRRKFKASRHQLIAGLVVDVGGKGFDGDEESQTRMARAITLAQTEVINQIHLAVMSMAGQTDLTPQQLAQGIADSINAVKQNMTSPWMLADNTQTTTHMIELNTALATSIFKQSEVWGFE